MQQNPLPSGGHFNPAVSFAMLTLGKLSAKDFLVYCVVQTAGAFIGAAGAFGIYYGGLAYQIIDFKFLP